MASTHIKQWLLRTKKRRSSFVVENLSPTVGVSAYATQKKKQLCVGRVLDNGKSIIDDTLDRINLNSRNHWIAVHHLWISLDIFQIIFFSSYSSSSDSYYFCRRALVLIRHFEFGNHYNFFIHWWLVITYLPKSDNSLLIRFKDMVVYQISLYVSLILKILKYKKKKERKSERKKKVRSLKNFLTTNNESCLSLCLSHSEWDFVTSFFFLLLLFLFACTTQIN